jgi:hypothetical protein
LNVILDGRFVDTIDSAAYQAFICQQRGEFLFIKLDCSGLLTALHFDCPLESRRKLFQGGNGFPILHSNFVFRHLSPAGRLDLFRRPSVSLFRALANPLTAEDELKPPHATTLVQRHVISLLSPLAAGSLFSFSTVELAVVLDAPTNIVDLYGFPGKRDPLAPVIPTRAEGELLTAKPHSLRLADRPSIARDPQGGIELTHRL